MTTAHRPTWNSAIASGSNPAGTRMAAGTTKIANRDVANYTKMKTRQPGQGAPEELLSRKEYSLELEKKEKKAKMEREGIVDTKPEFMAGAIQDNPFPEDADELIPSASEKDSDDDNDDDDDTEELMRELEKIKAERKEDEEKKKSELQKMDERTRREEVMKSNPLLSLTGSDLSLKRQWDDDTVFKNQARTAPKQKQRYINDAVRSDFHKKFLNKYIWIDGISH